MSNEQQSNGLGVAGFVLSIIGWFTCGVLSVIGFVMSLVALRNEPRGFAIAGAIVGGIGSIFSLVVIAAIAILGLGAVIGAIGLAGAFPEVNAYFEMGMITAQIEEYRAANGQLPPDLASVNVSTDFQTDHWGNAYDYRPQAGGTDFSIVSAGPDGQFDTPDDIEFNTSAP